MKKKDHLKHVLFGKEWEYSLRVRNVLECITQDPHIIQAVENTVNKINKIEYIKTKIGTEIESEEDIQSYSYDDAVNEANKILKYAVHGQNTRASYYEDRRKHFDRTNHHVVMTVFRQCLLDEKRSILTSNRYYDTLRFLDGGFNAISPR